MKVVRIEMKVSSCFQFEKLSMN